MRMLHGEKMNHNLITIAFISNFYNHHQKWLSDAFEHITDGNYCFIETQEMDQERRFLGWGKEEKPEYVIRNFASVKESYNVCDEIEKKDVVIIGAASECFVKTRKKSGDLIFRYSERPFKRKRNLLRYIGSSAKLKARNCFYKNIYMLCASAFTSYDYSKLGLFTDSCYKWGYFPEKRVYDNVNSLIKGKIKNSILWVGRFIEWKHPDEAIKIAAKLKNQEYSFTMNIMTPEKVREQMELSQIFLFTSDKNEGWGAVLNEAMNSGCAVVASHAIGAVPYLVKNGENGLVYESGNIEMLFDKVKLLIKKPLFAQKVGEKAYETIATEWNADIAAERFVNLADHILSGNRHPDLYSTGPCSKAEIIRDDWFEHEIKNNKKNNCSFTCE